MDSEVRRLDLPALLVIPAFEVTPEMLEADGVHLVPAAGDQFLNHLCRNVSSSLASSADITLVEEITNIMSSDSEDDASSNVEESDDRLGAILKIVKSNSKKLSSVKPLKDSLLKLAESSSNLENQIRIRRHRDNYVFARIKEEADGELNRTRENRVVVSGLERVSDGLSTHQAKKDYYTKVLTDLIAKACPEMDPKPAVLDVVVNIRRDQVNPSVEMRLDSVNGAFAFRKSAAALAKAQNPEFVKLFFSNSITQATRVRIEIMKAIAKRLTTTTEEAYVQGFISRPLLRYLSRNPAESFAAGTGRSYTFVDSVSRFGDLVQAHDLTAAYRRAGGTFQGAMEQYFVLLSEPEDRPVASGSNRSPLGGRGGVRGGRGGRGIHRGSARGFRSRKRFGSPQETPSSKKPSDLSERERK